MTDDWLTRLIRDATDSDDPTASRVAQRTLARRGRSGSAPTTLWWWTAGVITPVGAVCAALLIWLGPALLRPEPPPHQPLEGQGSWDNAVAGVTSTFDGEGGVTSTGREVKVRWSTGTISMNVDPTRNPRVEIVTADGTIRVTGTVFEVTRDALGTKTTVSRGSVEVSCTTGATDRVTSGGEFTCIPTTAAGLLGRARALRDSGSELTEVLANLNLAAAAASEGPYLREILAIKVDTLIRAERPTEALAVVKTALAQPNNHRKAELVAIAQALIGSLHGCDAARQWTWDHRANPGGLPEACRD